MTISIIVPCFNEEESLPLFYAEMEKIKFQLNDHFEYIFVNDGSKDRTYLFYESSVRKIIVFVIFLFREILEKKQLCMRVSNMQLVI